MTQIHWLWRRALRPILALLVAGVAAAAAISSVFYGLSLVEGDDSLTPESIGGFLAASLLLGVYIAAFTALPALVLVWVFRGLKAPRGWSDVVMAALMGATMIYLIGFTSDGLGLPPFGLSALFAMGGAVGGLVYWWVAGKPRPPY